MTDKARFSTQRVRTLLGLAVVAASILVAVTLAGLGFAQGSPTGSAQSASQNEYGKMTICHHTHSKKHEWVTITISKSAWPAHEAHGDLPHPCATSHHTNKGKHKGQHKSTPSHGKGHGK